MLIIAICTSSNGFVNITKHHQCHIANISTVKSLQCTQTIKLWMENVCCHYNTTYPTYLLMIKSTTTPPIHHETCWSDHKNHTFSCITSKNIKNIVHIHCPNTLTAHSYICLKQKCTCLWWLIYAWYGHSYPHISVATWIPLTIPSYNRIWMKYIYSNAVKILKYCCNFP